MNNNIRLISVSYTNPGITFDEHCICEAGKYYAKKEKLSINGILQIYLNKIGLLFGTKNLI